LPFALPDTIGLAFFYQEPGLIAKEQVRQSCRGWLKAAQVTDLLAHRSQAVCTQPDPDRIGMEKPARTDQPHVFPAPEQVHRPFLGKSALLFGLSGMVARLTQSGQDDLQLVQSNGILLADSCQDLMVALGQSGSPVAPGLPRLSACHLVLVHSMNLLHSLLQWSSVDGRNDVGTHADELQSIAAEKKAVLHTSA
jgi:hypothetical protein